MKKFTTLIAALALLITGTANGQAQKLAASRLDTPPGFSIPPTCNAAGSVALFLGSPVAMACDATGLNVSGTGATMQLRFGGTDVGIVRSSAGVLKVTDGSTGYGDIRAGGFVQGGNAISINNQGLWSGSGGIVGWASGATYDSELDVGLARSAAGVLKVTDGSTGAGKILVANGTAAAPSVAFASSTGTGIYYGGSSNGVFASGGSYIGAWSGASFEVYKSLQLNTDALGATYLRSAAAATLQLGAANAAAPVRQTIRAQGSRGTTDSNVSGADLNVQAGFGTGVGSSTAAGRRGDLRLQTQARMGAATTQSTAVDRFGAAGQVVTLTESSATAVLDVAVASGTAAGGTVWYTIRAADATDFQSLRGQVQWAAVNKGGTLTCTPGLVGTEVAAVSTGTLTNTASCTTGTNSISINLNAVSSLTQTTLYAYVSWQMDGTGVATTK